MRDWSHIYLEEGMAPWLGGHLTRRQRFWEVMDVWRKKKAIRSEARLELWHLLLTQTHCVCGWVQTVMFVDPGRAASRTGLYQFSASIRTRELHHSGKQTWSPTFTSAHVAALSMDRAELGADNMHVLVIFQGVRSVPGPVWNPGELCVWVFPVCFHFLWLP